MSELSVSRLDLIAGEIRAIKEQAAAVAGWAVLSVGQRLQEAKALCPHGEWGNYLQTLDYSERTAQNAIRMYEEYGQSPNPQALADLSATKAMILLGVSREERETLIENEPVANMSTRELKKRVKELQREKDEAAQQAELLQADFEALQANIEKLKTGESKAKAAAKTAKDFGKEQAEKVKSLKQELETERAKPAPEPVTVMVPTVPPEVEQELQALRDKAKKAPCEAVIRFRAHYDSLVNAFDSIRMDLDAIGKELPEDEATYRAAMVKAAQVFIDRVQADAPGPGGEG